MYKRAHPPQFWLTFSLELGSSISLTATLFARHLLSAQPNVLIYFLVESFCSQNRFADLSDSLKSISTHADLKLDSLKSISTHADLKLFICQVADVLPSLTL